MQSVEEACGMGAVHLGVVELERDRKRSLQPTAPVFAPNHERIVEYPAVHAHGTIDLVLRKGRSADDHAVRQIVVRIRFSHLPRESQVVVIEPPQIVGKGNIARTDLAPPVCDDGIDCDRIVLYQLAADR